MVIKHRFTIGALAAIGVLLLVLAPADASTRLNTPRTATRPVSARSQLRSAATLPKLSARPPVRNTALTPKAVSGAVEAAATATAAAATPLPISGFTSHGGAMAVDDAHQHLFVAGGDGVHGIAVMDFSGNVVTTLETGTSVTGLVVDQGTGTLYAALFDDKAIALIDTANLTETKRWPTDPSAPPQGLAIVDGQAWFPAWGNWAPGAMHIWSLDLTTGATNLQIMIGDRVAAVPGHPDWLAFANEHAITDSVSLADVSTTLPTVYGPVDSPTAQSDFAVSSDGAYMLAGGAGVAYNVGTDITQAFTFPPVSATGSVATQDSVYAVGTNSGSDNLKVYSFGNATATAQFTLSPGPVPHGLAFSGDATHLFTIIGTGSGTSLVVETRSDLIQTNISLVLPKRLKVGAGVTAQGTVTFTNQPYDGQVRTLHVTRTDKTGAHALPNVSTNTSGAFTVTDAASPLGKVTYTVTYDGDATHGPGALDTVGLREVPFDVNGDGFADLVVGAPGEDIGLNVDTGSITVLFGSSTGVKGTGSKEYDLHTPGVPGAVDGSEQFGWSQVGGDFNGDGYPDIAVSANALTSLNPAFNNAGAIWIFYGSATGLRTDNITQITVANFNQTDGIGYTGAFIGEVMTSGDFDGDGVDDLATGVFGNHEEVAVMYGATGGLSTTPHLITGNSPAFGSALSAGDINGDGRADLAVGAPLDLADKTYFAGAVKIYYGSATGLTTAGSQYINKDVAGVPGSVKPFTTDLPDEFGAQVVLADFTGDGRADLAVGAPGSPVTTGGVLHQDAGTVTAMYSVNGRISTAGAIEASQATAGVPGSPGTNDDLGAVMTGGDSNADGKAELVIFSPGDHLVTVVKGATGALSFSTATYFTQNSPGIPGADEPGDFWGDSLRFGNFKSPTGPQALAVGADGENTNQGAVTVIYSTTSGLTGTGSVTFTQNSAGIPGASENGDLFGSFFSF